MGGETMGNNRAWLAFCFGIVFAAVTALQLATGKSLTKYRIRQRNRTPGQYWVDIAIWAAAAAASFGVAIWGFVVNH